MAIKGRAPMTGYSRAQFGPAWPTIGGCDGRNDTLRRDLTNTTTQGTCTVETGILVSPYTGGTINFVRGPNSAIVQIDHVVALGDAWQTGAQALSAAQRETFANDESELLAVDGHSNEQKGDADAASWLPPNKSFRCEYVTIQVDVKAKYHLWVTQAEHDAIASVLANCGDTTGVVLAPVPAQPTAAPTAVKPTPTATQTPKPTTTLALACTASVSKSTPQHNDTVHLVVQTAAGAQLTVVAHYKSKDTVHTGTADGSGHGDVPFDIATATYGFTVQVDVAVSAGGQTAQCSTSFAPTA